MSRFPAVLLVLAAAWMAGAASALGAAFSWSGGGGVLNDQWSNTANWTGGVVPANSATTDLTFSVNGVTASFNDIPGFSANSITFGVGQNQLFTVSGSSVNLFGGGLSDLSTSTQTVSFGTIGLQASQSWSAATGSTMVVTSAIAGNGNLLELGLGGAGGNMIISGIISSTSNVIVAGPGMTAFTSVFNTYSGTTTVDGGFLQINSDGNLGVAASSVVIVNGGTIQTPQGWSSARYVSLASGTANIDMAGKSDTLSGIVSGTGSLVTIGSGTLTLGGLNTYTGGTFISSGTVSISTDANLGAATGGLTLANGGTLMTTANLTSSRGMTLNGIGGTFNTAAGTGALFTGVIGGAGALTKTGAGSLTLSGANTYGGGTFLNGGTLTLSGANTYAGGTTLNSGTLMLGANDSLPLNGALTMAAGTTFDLNNFSQNQTLGAVVNNGAINVRTGNLTLNNGYSGTGTMAIVLQTAVTPVNGNGINLNGGTLNFSFANPLVANGATFTPIAGTGIVGSTNTVAIVSPAALSLTPTYSATNVLLTVSYVPFSQIAATPNQQGVANIVENYRSAPTGDWLNVIGSINTLSVPQLQAAFDQMGPISLAAMKGLGIDGSTVQAAAVSQRQAVLAKGGDASGVASYTVRGHTTYPGTLVASAVDDIGSPAPVEFKSPGSPWGFFSSIVGTDGRVDATRSSGGLQPGYHTSMVGLTAGGDYKFTEGFAAGLAGAFLNGHAGISSPASGSIHEHTAREGVYGSWFEEAWRGNFYVGGAQDYFDTNRDIQFGGIQRTATAAPRGNELNASLGGSVDAYSGAYGALAPFVGLNYDRLHVNSFTETGAGVLDLQVSPQTDESLRSSLGLKWSPQLGATSPYLSMGWRHEFEDQSRPIEAQLASGSGVFSVATGAIAQDGFLLGAGVFSVINANWSVKADYTGDFRTGFDEQAFNGAVRYRF